MTQVQLETRIQEALDGVISEENWLALQDEMARSDEACRTYCRYVQLHGLLGQRSKGLQALTFQGPVIPMNELVTGRRRKAFVMAIGLAAVLLVMAAVVMNMVFVNQGPEMVFKVSPGTQYELTHAESEETPAGMALTKGSVLKLQQGVVELSFESGVRAIVSGPSELSLDDDNELTLKRGKAWFDVPRKARGFRVNTEELCVIDLGTQFGVYANATGEDEVHLFKGIVEVNSTMNPTVKLDLTEGGLKVHEQGELVSVDVNEALFLTELPDTLPYLHWSFDGEGDERYLVQGSATPVENLKTREYSTQQDSAIRTVPGKFGQAIAADGLGSYVASEWRGVPGGNPRTLAYWIRLPKEERYINPIVGWGRRNINGSANTGSFFSFVETMSWGVVCGVEVGWYWMKGQTNLQDEEWHHVAHVFTGKNKADGTPDIVTYVDGREESMTRYLAAGKEYGEERIVVNTITEPAESVPLQIFTHLWVDRNQGETYTAKPELDELYIFEAALLPAEIKKLYRFNNYQGGTR